MKIGKKGLIFIVIFIVAVSLIAIFVKPWEWGFFRGSGSNWVEKSGLTVLSRPDLGTKYVYFAKLPTGNWELENLFNCRCQLANSDEEYGDVGASIGDRFDCPSGMVFEGPLWLTVECTTPPLEGSFYFEWNTLKVQMQEQ